MSRILLLPLLLLVCNAKASLVSVGSRSLLRAFDNSKSGNSDLPDAAVELNITNFDAVLRDTPATHAIVEFFAHWCPACRNYKPHYEKVARLFNGPDAVYPGLILMTRVDCALKANTKLCDKFSVGHFPMLLWGHPSKFVSGSWEPGLAKSNIRLIDDGRTADRLLNWINRQIGSSYGLDDRKFENEHLPSNVSDPEQIVRAVYDVEEATATAFDIILEHKMIKSETRASLIRFLQLMVAHHPSRRCRKGSAEVLINFDDLLPNGQNTFISGMDALKNFMICGKGVPRGYWMFCRGSKKETRGFSCGLWVLLHSLSVRIEDEESQFAFTAMCEFIHNFFICEECRQHFYEMCSSVSTPPNRTRDFALWLWSAHNRVNERLMVVEASLLTLDPKFPKVMWPPKSLCPSCYSPSRANNASANQITWDRNEVFEFLARYYGETLVSLYKDKSSSGEDDAEPAMVEELTVATNAVVVPAGAALAIALASCVFGALACYWRSRQKNRKYLYLHSLKKI